MSSAQVTSELLVQQQGSITTVTLNRPELRNALTFEMYSGLAEICQSPPEGTRVIVIRGSGDKAFAAGTDIKQFRQFESAQNFLDYENRIDEVLDAIETCKVPTIAAISGACTGGGAMIAAVCDLRISTADLKFGFPIARTLGNTLSSRSLARLGAIIGQSRTREIIFTSRLIAADEASSIGLVSEVLADAAAVFDHAIQLATALAEKAPLTLYATKMLQHRLLKGDTNDEDMVLMCYQSSDFQHGLESFLAKKKPEWEGK